MYYLLYIPLYLVSLLPFPVLYFISDGLYGLLYYIIGYRKEVVYNNIKIAFPEKTDKEIKRIARQFYKNLVDTFIETIKMLSITDKAFAKRNSIDFRETDKIAAKGKNIQFQSGHQMNWEYVNWVVAKRITIPWVGVYMPITNKALNRLFYNLRGKFNTILISAAAFKAQTHGVFDNQYSLALAADQTPGNPQKAYWLNLFNRPSAFVKGPDTGAQKNNPAIIFVTFIKKKRGYYHFQEKVITENAAEFKPGHLTNLYRDFLEETIRSQPCNYLWSHRRWKWEYKAEYKDSWIDEKSPAPEL